MHPPAITAIKARMFTSLNRVSGTNTSPPLRFSILLATLLLTVLQVIAVSHLISHTAHGDDGDTGDCELCLNAVHGGSALVAAATSPPAFHALAGELAASPERQVSSRTPTVCRARGPPSLA
ncbi:MAG: hypothetical protein J0M16_00040 [Gammaproteobacteria bacterium]|nr:hypothetical protein [Gammaproteobacteria bacterium]